MKNARTSSFLLHILSPHCHAYHCHTTTHPTGRHVGETVGMAQAQCGGMGVNHKGNVCCCGSESGREGMQCRHSPRHQNRPARTSAAWRGAGEWYAGKAWGVRGASPVCQEGNGPRRGMVAYHVPAHPRVGNPRMVAGSCSKKINPELMQCMVGSSSHALEG